MKKILFSLILGLFCLGFAPIRSVAQAQKKDSIRLSSKFKFADGVYASFADLRANRPTEAAKNLDISKSLRPRENSIIINSVKKGAEAVNFNAFFAVVIDGNPYLRSANDSTGRTFIGLQTVGKLCYYSYSADEETRIEMPVHDPETKKVIYTGAVKNKVRKTVRKIFNFNTGEINDLTINNLERMAADDKNLVNTMHGYAPDDLNDRLVKCLLIYNDRNFVFIPK